MSRRFELLLLKNTLAIAIPAMSVFALLIAFLIKYPIFDKLECKDINEETLETTTLEDMLERLHEDGTYNVLMDTGNLYYTGFDYYEDNVREGSYYYTIDEGCIHLYLLSRTDGEPFLESVAIKGKIVKDVVTSNHILNQLSQGNGMEDLTNTGFFSEYIVSEIDYPRSYIRLVYLFYATPIAICGLILLYTLFVWLNPRLHTQTRQLAVYGKTGKVIKQIDKQLREEYVYRKGNIYITSDYMIVSYMTRTDVIKISMIKYLSKNEVEKKGLLGRTRTIYRLTLSDPEIFFYEVDLLSEELCDDLLDYLETMKA